MSKEKYIELSPDNKNYKYFKWLNQNLEWKVFVKIEEIKYKKNYLLVCPKCSNEVEFSKKELTNIDSVGKKICLKCNINPEFNDLKHEINKIKKNFPEFVETFDENKLIYLSKKILEKNFYIYSVNKNKISLKCNEKGCNNVEKTTTEDILDNELKVCDHNSAKDPLKTGYIYFFRTTQNKLKIGFTRSLKKRFFSKKDNLLQNIGNLGAKLHHSFYIKASFDNEREVDRELKELESKYHQIFKKYKEFEKNNGSGGSEWFVIEDGDFKKELNKIKDTNIEVDKLLEYFQDLVGN